MTRRTSSRFVTVSKQEFESWLQSYGYPWNIVEDNNAQEYIYNVTPRDTTINPHVSVRVYSTVDKRTDVTRDIGTDAIRIVYWDNVNDMPLGKGKKLLRVVSDTSTIAHRLRGRIERFFAGLAEVQPVNFPYVRHVLHEYVEHIATRPNDFAQSLLEQLERNGRLSSKQVAYIVGEENPNGYPTMEKKLNDRGLAPRMTFQMQQTLQQEERQQNEEAREQAQFEAERRLFDENEAPNIMPRMTVTGRTVSPRPNLQEQPRDRSSDYELLRRAVLAHTRRRQNTMREEDAAETAVVDNTAELQQSLLSVMVEEESDRQVDEFDRFVKQFDGPTAEEVDLTADRIGTDVVTERYGYEYSFSHLNPLQSKVLREAVDVDCNLVIGANTSSGKTVCAELLAMDALEQGQRVVYLSPLKSLTQEKYADWQKLFRGKKICILTGDYVLSQQRKEELSEADIIVMTSEMCDSRTRRMRREGNEWLYEVGLLIVDEAHILTTDRGHAVECGVMRFTSLNSNARVLLLSATMPNVIALAKWLTVLNGKESKTIKSDWRPVELNRHFPIYEVVRYGNGSLNYAATQENKVRLAVDIVCSRGKEDQKFLVFVHDKTTGRRLVRMFEQAEVNAHFHNADLDLEERLEIEKRFTNPRGNLRVLVSTSTLAWGRNLPARNVIIVGGHRGITPVDPLDLIQMAGRAGRYGIDTTGDVYQLTPLGESAIYTEMHAVPREITSVLAKRETLAFHMLAEVQNGVISNAATFKRWFEKSFAYVGVNPADRGNIDELVDEVFTDMLAMEMVKKVSPTRYRCTKLGDISAWLYYSPYDIASWNTNFAAYGSTATASNTEDLCLAWALAAVPTFNMGYCPKECTSNYEEMQRLLARDMVHLDLGHTLHTAAAWAMLKGEDAPPAIKQAVRGLMFDLDRMLNAIRLIDKRHAQWGMDWKVIQARFKYGITEELVPLVQIPGVGGVRAKKLYENGLKTVAAVAKPSGKRKMLSIFKPALVNKIYMAAKRIAKEARDGD